MTTTTKIRAKARKVALKAGAAVLRVEKQIATGIQRRRRQRVLKDAAGAVLATSAAVLASATVRGVETLVRNRGGGRAGQLGHTLTLPLDLERATARLTDCLKAEGFGILTRIDVRATLAEKLGAEFRPYLILGACNPGLAQRALEADPEAGLLLPCNITLETVPGGATVVRIVNPAAMLGRGLRRTHPTLLDVAMEAKEKLGRVAERLTAHARTVVY